MVGGVGGRDKLLTNVKPPLTKTRHQTPAQSTQIFGDGTTSNNFRMQTFKGIRSNAFINFSQCSTANLTHVQSHAGAATSKARLKAV